jgi:hypothetical protein
MNENGLATCPPSPDDSNTEIPLGYCQCGCGQLTTISRQNHAKKGWVLGQPHRFMRGHAKQARSERLPSRILFIDGFECRTIPLTLGYEAIVYAIDYAACIKFNWYSMIRYRQNGSIRTVYAIRRNGEAREFLHQFVAVLKGESGIVDHYDHNGLNCCRHNLRPSDSIKNGQNGTLRCNNTSGYKGVSWDKNMKKWHAYIQVNGKLMHLGYFPADQLIAAARAYDAASILYHAHGCTNVMLGLLPPLDEVAA